MAVEIAELRGELNGVIKDLARVENAQKECLDFQRRAERSMSNSESEVGLTRKEVQMLEAFIKQHQGEHNDQAKTMQARQWALWMVIIATCVSSIAGLIMKLVG